LYCLHATFGIGYMLNVQVMPILPSTN